MERYNRMIVFFLWILNFLFVYMGYVGISKIERYNHPPFHSSDSMLTIFYNFYVIPDEIVIFWHSTPGHWIIWSGCIILPLVAAYILFAKEKVLVGLITLLLSITPFGIVGFLIWLHAFIDLPHDW